MGNLYYITGIVEEDERSDWDSRGMGADIAEEDDLSLLSGAPIIGPSGTFEALGAQVPEMFAPPNTPAPRQRARRAASRIKQPTSKRRSARTAAKPRMKRTIRKSKRR